MDSYTWTHQCRLTSKSLHSLALCGHLIPSRRPTISTGWWRWRVKGIHAVCTSWRLLIILIGIPCWVFLFVVSVRVRVVPIFSPGNMQQILMGYMIPAPMNDQGYCIPCSWIKCSLSSQKIKLVVLSINVNRIWWWSLSFEVLRSVGYSFIAITSRSTQSTVLWEPPFHCHDS